MSTYNINVVVDPTRAVAGVQRVEVALKGVQAQADRTQLSLSRLAGTFFGAYAVTQVINLAKAFDAAENRIRPLAASAGQLTTAMELLRAQNHRTGTSLSDSTESVRDLFNALRGLGLNLIDVVGLYGRLNDVLAQNGIRGDEAQRAIQRLSNSFTDGKLTIEGMRNLVQNFPQVIDALNARFGTTTQQLQVMAVQGRLTTGVLVNTIRELSTPVAAVGGGVAESLNRVYDSLVKLASDTGLVSIVRSVLNTLAEAFKTLSEAIAGTMTALSTLGERGAAAGDRMRADYLGQQIANARGNLDRRGLGAVIGPMRGVIEAQIEGLQLERNQLLQRTEERRLRESLVEIQQYSAAGGAATTPRVSEAASDPQAAARAVELHRQLNQELMTENRLLGLGTEERLIHARLETELEKFRKNKTPLGRAEEIALEGRIRQLHELRHLTTVVQNSFEAMFKGMEDALISFVQTGVFEFWKFADAVIADLLRIALRAYVTRPLLNLGTGLVNPMLGGSSVIGGSGIGAGGTTTMSTPGLMGFASGGSFTVGGRGGTDSQLVAFKATPGENVRVNTPGQGGTAPVINIINMAPDTKVESKKSTVGGQSVTEIVVSAIDKGIASGRFDRSMATRYAASPQMKRR